MNSKILIVGAAVIVVLGGVLIISKPKEAGAPMVVTEAPQEEVADANVEDVQSNEVSPLPTKAPVNTPPTSAVNVPIPTTPAPAPFIGTVYYDGENFIPETITIVEGGTVVFENTGDRMMWVGSDDHPTHTRYPVKNSTNCLGSSFDQCKASGAGTSWSYTFTELGEWSYHNHTRARDVGEVVVLSKEDYLKFKEKEASGR